MNKKITKSERKQLQAAFGKCGYRVTEDGVLAKIDHIEGAFWAFKGWTVAEALRDNC